MTAAERLDLLQKARDLAKKDKVEESTYIRLTRSGKLVYREAREVDFSHLKVEHNGS